MRMMSWAWPVSVALAVGAGFVGGRNWERRHHGPDPFGPRGNRAALDHERFGPAEFQPGGLGHFPPPPPPHRGEPRFRDDHRPPDRGFSGGPPPHRQYPDGRYPDPQGFRPTEQPPESPAEKGPKLSAAEAARLHALKEMRSAIGSPLQKEGVTDEENAEANLMFEAALRSVIAEEMAKPAATAPTETAATPEAAAVESGAVAENSAGADAVAAPVPTADAPPQAAPEVSAPANPSTEAEPAANPAVSPPGLLPSEVKPTSGTESAPLLPAPELSVASAEELRSAARFLEQRAAEAEEAGAAERADKLRELAATLWRESRSQAKE